FRRIETVLRRPYVVIDSVDAVYLLKAVKDDHGIPVAAQPSGPIKPALLSAGDPVHRVGNACSESHGLGNVSDSKLPLGALLPCSSLRRPCAVARQDVRANAARQNEQEKTSSRPQKDFLRHGHRLGRVMCQKMCLTFRGETRKSLRCKEAPVGIEP